MKRGNSSIIAHFSSRSVQASELTLPMGGSSSKPTRDPPWKDRCSQLHASEILYGPLIFSTFFIYQHTGTGHSFEVAVEKAGQGTHHWSSARGLDNLDNLDDIGNTMSESIAMCDQLCLKIREVQHAELVPVLVTDGDAVQKMAVVEKAKINVMNLGNKAKEVCVKVRDLHDMSHESSQKILLDVNARTFLTNHGAMIIDRDGNMPQHVEIGQVVKSSASALKLVGQVVGIAFSVISFLFELMNPAAWGRGHAKNSEGRIGTLCPAGQLPEGMDFCTAGPPKVPRCPSVCSPDRSR